MGAIPLWATLSLSLPEIEDSWLAGFSRGLYSLAGPPQYQKSSEETSCAGHGPVSMQATGCLESARTLTRTEARPKDFLYVTGTLGDCGPLLGVNAGPRKSRSIETGS